MSAPELSPPSSPVGGPLAPRSTLGALEDELDPELLALPDPPRRERSLTLLLLAVTVLASMGMVLSLARDAAYAFASKRPVDLGDLRAASPASAGANRFARGEALLGAVGSIRYERAFESDSYRLAPVAGRPDVWIEMRVPAGEESSRFVPPSSFVGRLVPFDAAGPRHRGLAQAIAEASGEVVPRGAWLLVDGETPEDARWAVALVVLFFGFACWNAGVMVRLARKVPLDA